MIMKTPVIILLCVSLLLEGCYSYCAIAQDENGKVVLKPDQNIKIDLKDETEIEVEPYRYISVEEPENFVYGTGIRIDKAKDSSVEFTGKIYPVSCDSNPSYVSSGWYSKGERRYDYYLSDGTVTQFNQGKFIVVDSSKGPGLWICNGEIVSGWSDTSINNTRIPFENIKNIETDHFSVGRTVLCVLGVGAGAFVCLALLLAISIRNDDHFND